MVKKLHHLSLHALAEPIRYILYYTKQEFEDIKHDVESWPIQEIKDSPLYEEGERILSQSLAIAKYVARNTDLVPIDPWLEAVVESAAHTIYDYWSEVVAYIKEKNPEKKKEMKRKLIEETIDDFFTRLENQLKENGGYFCGKLSWAEFILCGIVEATNLILGTKLEKNYPTIAAVVEKIKNLPGVKEYIEERGPLVFKH